LRQREIAFDEKRDLVMNKRQKLPYHTNGMRFSAFDANGNEIATPRLLLGRWRLRGEPGRSRGRPHRRRHHAELPYPFHSGDELLAQCEASWPEPSPA
jgi:L-serine dehydratase